MLKRLLYLYNDGHNPFPKLGKGGLGYHLPQYKKRIHGEALHIFTNDNGDHEIIDDGNDDDPSWYTTDPRLSSVAIPETRDRKEVVKKEVVKKELEPSPTIQTEAEIKEAERLAKIAKAKKGKEEEAKMIAERQSKKQHIEQQITPMSNEVQKLLKKEPIKTKEVSQKPELTKDNLDMQITLRNEVSGVLLSQPKYLQYFEYIKYKYPNITDRELNLNIDDIISDCNKNAKKYIQSISKTKTEEDIVYDKQKKQEKFETSEINYDINQVRKLAKDKTLYPTKGHAFEHVMITEHQDELYEISESKEDFIPASKNSVFKNSDGASILCYNGIDTLESKALFDASNPKVVTDFKWYPKSDDSFIQFSKFKGSPSFQPCYEIKNDKLVLYNIWCKDTNSWVEPENYKDVTIFSRLKSGKFNWSITNFLNSLDDCPLKSVNINGRQFVQPDIDEIVKRGILQRHNHEDKFGNSDSNWVSVNYKDMTPINKPQKKKSSKKKS